MTAVTAVAVAVTVAAVGEVTGGGEFAVFAQYGVLGVIVVVLIMYARGTVRREQDRADRLEASKDDLTQRVLERVIPALEASARAVDETQQIVRLLQQQRLGEDYPQQRRNPPWPRPTRESPDHAGGPGNA